MEDLNLEKEINNSSIDIIQEMSNRNENIKNTILNTTSNHIKKGLKESVDTLHNNIPEIIDVVGVLLESKSLSLSIQGRIVKILESLFEIILQARDQNSKKLDVETHFYTITRELYALRSTILNDLKN